MLGNLGEYSKIVTPLVTGGLAGAMFTFFVNYALSKKRQSKLLVKVDSSDYSFIESDPELKNIKVSYRGNEYEKMAFFQMIVENNSPKTVNDAQFLLTFGSGTRIADRSSVTSPIDRNTSWSLAQSKDGQDLYHWNIGEMKPKDTARLRIIVSPSVPKDWKWRGGDDVEVVKSGQINEKKLENDIRNILMWISAYIAIGQILTAVEGAQSIFILITMPLIVPNIRRWISLFIEHHDAERNTIAINGHSNIVSLGGESKINAHFDRTNEDITPRDS